MAGTSFGDTSASRLWVVVAFFVLTSVSFERGLSWVEHHMRRRGANSMVAAVAKIRDELMVMAWGSLILQAVQNFVTDLCVPVAEHGIACLSEYSSVDMAARATQHQGACSDGMEPWVSAHAMHQAHIFVFTLTLVHIIFTATTIVGSKRQHGQLEALEPSHVAHVAPEHMTVADYPESKSGRFWYAFRTQFRRGVEAFTYISLRRLFVLRHNLHPEFQWHQYLTACFNSSVSELLGVHWWMWVIVMAAIFMDGYLMAGLLLPVSIVTALVVGTKLTHIALTLSYRCVRLHYELQREVDAHVQRQAALASGRVLSPDSESLIEDDRKAAAAAPGAASARVVASMKKAPQNKAILGIKRPFGSHRKVASDPAAGRTGSGRSPGPLEQTDSTRRLALIAQEAIASTGGVKVAQEPHGGNASRRTWESTNASGLTDADRRDSAASLAGKATLLVDTPPARRASGLRRAHSDDVVLSKSSRLSGPEAGAAAAAAAPGAALALTSSPQRRGGRGSTGSHSGVVARLAASQGSVPSRGVPASGAFASGSAAAASYAVVVNNGSSESAPSRSKLLGGKGRLLSGASASDSGGGSDFGFDSPGVPAGGSPADSASRPRRLSALLPRSFSRLSQRENTADTTTDTAEADGGDSDNDGRAGDKHPHTISSVTIPRPGPTDDAADASGADDDTDVRRSITASGNFGLGRRVSDTLAADTAAAADDAAAAAGAGAGGGATPGRPHRPSSAASERNKGRSARFSIRQRSSEAKNAPTEPVSPGSVTDDRGRRVSAATMGSDAGHRRRSDMSVASAFSVDSRGSFVVQVAGGATEDDVDDVAARLDEITGAHAKRLSSSKLRSFASAGEALRTGDAHELYSGQLPPVFSANLHVSSRRELQALHKLAKDNMTVGQFWFDAPDFTRALILFVMFASALEISFTLFYLWQSPCYFDAQPTWYLVVRLACALLMGVFLSMSLIPLWSIVSHMGTQMRPGMLLTDEHRKDVLERAERAVQRRLENNPVIPRRRSLANMLAGIGSKARRRKKAGQRHKHDHDGGGGGGGGDESETPGRHVGSGGHLYDGSGSRLFGVRTRSRPSAYSFASSDDEVSVVTDARMGSVLSGGSSGSDTPMATLDRRHSAAPRVLTAGSKSLSGSPYIVTQVSEDSTPGSVPRNAAQRSRRLTAPDQLTQPGLALSVSAAHGRNAEAALEAFASGMSMTPPLARHQRSLSSGGSSGGSRRGRDSHGSGGSGGKLAAITGTAASTGTTAAAVSAAPDVRDYGVLPPQGGPASARLYPRLATLESHDEGASQASPSPASAMTPWARHESAGTPVVVGARAGSGNRRLLQPLPIPSPKTIAAITRDD